MAQKACFTLSKHVWHALKNDGKLVCGAPKPEKSDAKGFQIAGAICPGCKSAFSP